MRLFVAGFFFVFYVCSCSVEALYSQRIMVEETVWVDKKCVGFYRADFGGQKTERAARHFYCGGRFQGIDWRCFMENVSLKFKPLVSDRFRVVVFVCFMESARFQIFPFFFRVLTSASICSMVSFSVAFLSSTTELP